MENVKFLGVYSTRKPKSNPSASDHKPVMRKQLYFVWRTEDEEYHQRAIDNAYKPIGDFESLAQDEFYAKYLYEARVQATPLVHYEKKMSDEEEAAFLQEFIELDIQSDGRDNETFNIIKESNNVSNNAHEISGQREKINEQQNISHGSHLDSVSKKERSFDLTPASLEKNASQIDALGTIKTSLDIDVSDDDFSNNHIDLLTNDVKKSKEIFDPDKPEANPLKLSKAKLLEMELREIFALQIAKYKKERAKQSEREIEKILRREEGIVEEHRFMFADFGIDLRKIKLYELAKLAFNRAKELKENDPNIWFNLARVHYELKEYKVALECIRHCLELSPEHEYAIRLKSATAKALAVATVIQ